LLLRDRLLAFAPDSAKRRKVLKNPQQFLFEVGDVLIYPTSNGRCINPYFSSLEKMNRWQHDGWGAMVIAERGRAFECGSSRRTTQHRCAPSRIPLVLAPAGHLFRGSLQAHEAGQNRQCPD